VSLSSGMIVLTLPAGGWLREQALNAEATTWAQCATLTDHEARLSCVFESVFVQGTCTRFLTVCCQHGLMDIPHKKQLK